MLPPQCPLGEKLGSLLEQEYPDAEDLPTATALREGNSQGFPDAFIVNCRRGVLAVLDANDGDVLAAHDLHGDVFASPVAVPTGPNAHTLLVGTRDSKFHALDCVVRRPPARTQNRRARVRVGAKKKQAPSEAPA